MMRSAVLTQISRVTDGRTDIIGVAYTHYSIYAVVRKKEIDTLVDICTKSRKLNRANSWTFCKSTEFLFILLQKCFPTD